MPEFKQLPVIGVVQDILVKMGGITPEQVKEALSKTSTLEGGYGVLWGHLDMDGRRRDNIFLKLVEVQREVLEFVQKLQANPPYWNIVARLVLAKQIAIAKGEEDPLD